MARGELRLRDRKTRAVEAGAAAMQDKTPPPQAEPRIMGVEYIVSAKLFATLPAEEKKLWHSHAPPGAVHVQRRS